MVLSLKLQLREGFGVVAEGRVGRVQNSSEAVERGCEQGPWSQIGLGS